MSGRFMRIKRIIIPTITMVIIASQLFGCSCSTQKELHNMINNGDQIEIEVPELNVEELGTESELVWTPLSELTNYTEFRNNFDSLFGIEKTTYSKSGVLYIDNNGNANGNNTLLNVFSNKSFVENYWNNEEKQDALRTLAVQLYVDVDENSTDSLYASINAYFNLLADNEVNYYNGQTSLTRAEAMTMLMRATTPVETLKKNESFTANVGESDFTDYAGYVANDSYLTTADKSLNNQTFNGTITRGEFIYMVVNNIFGSDIINNTDISSISLRDCKATTKKYEYKEDSYIKSYDLNYAIQSPDDGAPADLYKAIAVANKLGVISGETRWDEALTKSEGVELIIDAILAYNSLNGFKTEAESGEVAETDYTARAEAKYKEVADQLSISESTYVSEYLEMIKNGSTPEQAEGTLLTKYPKLEMPTEAPEQPTSGTTIEKPTEKPVEKPTVDPFTIEPSGKYTDKQELVDGAFTFYLRTYENGAKEYVVYVSIVNKYYRVAEVGVVPESVLLDISTILQENYEKQEQQAQQQAQQQQQQTTSKPASSNKEEETTEWNPAANWGENQSDDWYDPDWEFDPFQ